MNEEENPGKDTMDAESRNFVRCVVCGQQAHGMYFGAIVCLPCKSFFIRCTKEGQPRFTCQGTKTCNIQGGNRMRCQYCRFQRCLDAGMARKEKPERVEPGEGQELCHVCSDIANGIHFGVMTCEGCKKFFRRALKECSSYVCKQHQTCKLNPRNRNACRYCRYQKCVQLGMSRKAIRMGRPRKPKPGHRKLENITSLLNGALASFGHCYPVSDSGSSDSGPVDDYGYQQVTHMAPNQHVKYAGLLPPISSAIAPISNAIAEQSGGLMITSEVEKVPVKNEPVDMYGNQNHCSQWSQSNNWPVTDRKIKVGHSSPQQATSAVRKPGYAAPDSCSFTGLLAEASMPLTSALQSGNNSRQGQFDQSALGENVPLTYDVDQLNEILAMLPTDGPNGPLNIQLQNELRSLTCKEPGLDNHHLRVILNTPTVPLNPRPEKVAPPTTASVLQALCAPTTPPTSTPDLSAAQLPVVSNTTTPIVSADSQTDLPTPLASDSRSANNINFSSEKSLSFDSQNQEAGFPTNYSQAVPWQEDGAPSIKPYQSNYDTFHAISQYANQEMSVN